MPRAEVRFQRNLDGSLLVSVEKAPAAVRRQLEALRGLPDAAVLRALESDPLPDGAVRDAGEALYRWLEEAECTRELLLLLRTAAADRSANCPLYLEMMAPEPKALPWEVLRDPGTGFLALDRRWPVCRRVSSAVDLALPDQVLDPPLRLAAVLSAAGVDASGEWQALRRAVAAVAADRLPVRLLLMVGDPDLLERVEADLAEGFPGQEPAVDAAAPARHDGEVFTVSSASDLKRRLLEFQPHLLHLFCHGTPDHGGMLQLARPTDVVQGHPVGSVVLGKEDFADLGGAGAAIWLLTLNACDSGRAAGTHALTEHIAEAGFPAVVGMREPVRSADAHVFTGALYADLLRHLASLEERAAAGGPAAGEGDGSDSRFHALDFPSLLLEPRRLLAERHAAGLPFHEAAAHRKEWSLPVLFVRPEPLRVAVRRPRRRSRGAAPAPEGPGLEERIRRRSKLETLIRLRDGLAASPDVDAARLARLDAVIDELLEQRLAG